MKHTLLLTALLGASLGGCATGDTPPAAATSSAAITVDNHRLLQRQSTGETTTLWQSPAEIEALAQSGDRLLWATDAEVPTLWQGRLSQGTLNAKQIGPLAHDVDGLCFAPLNDTTSEAFISNGDGAVFHYWLQQDGAMQLRPVRTLTANPDIDRCLVSDTHLYLDDPYLGVIKTERNPETDGILRPATDNTDQPWLARLKATPPANSSNPVRADLPSISPDRETDPVENAGDAADDPAILAWQDGDFWIAGTDKQQGLRLFDASGKQIHFLPRGRINNVDALALDKDSYLLAASNRTDKTIDLYLARRSLNQLSFIKAIALDMNDPYGLCMGQSDQGIAIFVGDSDSQLQHWQLTDAADQGRLVARYSFSSQTEGCVYAPTEDAVYVGQEDEGIWRIDLKTRQQTLIEGMAAGHLVADVEGVDIYSHPQRGPLLLASSQGDDSYVLYALNPWQFLLKFTVGPNLATGLDGASETDGLAVTSRALAGFPEGIIVVQDGRNRAPAANQNFKIIDWRKLDALLPPAAR